MEHVDVLVVGGGSAGLSISRELTTRGIEHVVLERGRIGQAWRDRWDSFCLVTPNWTVRLPGGDYAGADPDGFMPRDEIVAHLERYAAASGTPIREGVAVQTIERAPGDGFVARTTVGDLQADRVILGTGAFQRPHRPDGAASLPDGLLQLDLRGYRNPADLPPGPVLIVGSGQSGCQLAEELQEAGRDVVLSCGKAPWAPRRLGGYDLVWWLEASGFLDLPVAALPTPAARLVANPLATGHGGREGNDGHPQLDRARRYRGVSREHGRGRPRGGDRHDHPWHHRAVVGGYLAQAVLPCQAGGRLWDNRVGSVAFLTSRCCFSTSNRSRSEVHLFAFPGS